MKVYHHIDEFVNTGKAVVTIGTFDGVHLGHKKIINRLVETAASLEAESVILTFFPHPRMILHPEDESLKLISTIDEKINLLTDLGVDHLIITPFTRDFSNLLPEDYIKDVLVGKIGMKRMIIGYDHRFGKDRKGGLDLLMQYSDVYGYRVEEIPQEEIDSITISSTKIRKALLDGNVGLASTFLGYPFELSGMVIKGDQIGRTIGFPTANLDIKESYKLIPKDGIYAVRLDITNSKDPKNNTEGQLMGMGYIGNRPTVSGMRRNIEVNILDFDRDIYDATVTIYFIEYVRGDKKLNGLPELQHQIALDKTVIKEILS